MKPDPYEQYNHSLQFPAPFFVSAGPGHVRIRDADEMADHLSEIGEQGYMDGIRVATYVKLPFVEHLVLANVRFETNPEGDEIFRFVEAESGKPIMLMESVELHLHGI